MFDLVGLGERVRRDRSGSGAIKPRSFVPAVRVSLPPRSSSCLAQPATVEELPNPAALQAQIDGLKQLLQQMETRIAEKDVLLAKQDARIEKILTALPAPKIETPAPAPEVSRLRRTWRWLRTTG